MDTEDERLLMKAVGLAEVAARGGKARGHQMHIMLHGMVVGSHKTMDLFVRDNVTCDRALIVLGDTQKEHGGR